jgi:hypothetical protein
MPTVLRITEWRNTNGLKRKLIFLLLMTARGGKDYEPNERALKREAALRARFSPSTEDAKQHY